MEERQQQRVENIENNEIGRVEEEEIVSDDGPPPVLLNYRFCTVIDDTGNMPAGVSFRSKMGSLLRAFKDKVPKRHRFADLIKDAGMGHFFELDDEHWESGCGNLLHYFLLRRIQTKKKNELWFMVGNKPIRFGVREFYLVSGLNCSPYPSDECITKAIDNVIGFVDKLKKHLNRKHIFAKDLWDIVTLRSKVPFTIEEKTRCAAMYLIHLVILGEQKSKQVDEAFLAFTVSPTFFCSYPWGRESYDRILRNLDRDLHCKAYVRAYNIAKGKPNEKQVKYSIACFWQAFYVWAYEAIDIYGKLLGARSTENPNIIPRLLRWHRGPPRKTMHLNWLESTISNNEVHCFPMLRPSEDEQRSRWMENLVEMEDVADEAIDELKKELKDISVLRPCDGIIKNAQNNEREENEPNNEEREQDNEDQEHQQVEEEREQNRTASSPRMQARTPIPSSDFNDCDGFGPVSPMMESSRRRFVGGGSGSHDLAEKVEDLVRELGELKSICEKTQKCCVETQKQVAYLVKLQDLKQPRDRRMPYWRTSPSWTSYGKKKRKAPKPNPEDIAKKLNFMGKKRKTKDSMS